MDECSSPSAGTRGLYIALKSTYHGLSLPLTEPTDDEGEDLSEQPLPSRLPESLADFPSGEIWETATMASYYRPSGRLVLLQQQFKHSHDGDKLLR